MLSTARGGGGKPGMVNKSKNKCSGISIWIYLLGNLVGLEARLKKENLFTLQTDHGQTPWQDKSQQAIELSVKVR